MEVRIKNTYGPMRNVAIVMLCGKSCKDENVRNLDVRWDILRVCLAWSNGTKHGFRVADGFSCGCRRGGISDGIKNASKVRQCGLDLGNDVGIVIVEHVSCSHLPNFVKALRAACCGDIDVVEFSQLDGEIAYSSFLMVSNSFRG